MIIFKSNIPRHIKCQDLIIIIFSATLMRVILFFGYDYQRDLYGGDSSYYIETGRNIMEHGVHGLLAVPTFYRPPLYSLFAGVVASISETAIFFYVVHSAIFIVFSIRVYFFLRRFGVMLAFLSALLIAVSPFDILMNGRVLSENLVTPLLVLGSLYFINSQNSKTRFFLSGALLGGAAISRDIYLLYPVVLLVTGFFMKTNRRHLVIFFLGFSLFVIPWMYRNSQLPSGGLFLSKGIFWVNLWAGTWERNSDWTYMPGNYNFPPEAFQTFANGKLPETVIDAAKSNNEEFFKKLTIDYILEHPVKVVFTWVARYPILWFGTRSGLNTSYLARYSVSWYSMKATFYIINGIIIILAALGIFIALRTKKIPVLLCVPVIYNALIYIPLHNVEARYSLPVMPFLIIYCSYYILYLVDKFKLARGMQ